MRIRGSGPEWQRLRRVAHSRPMRQAQLILVNGLPGTGKSTLARLLAARYHWPLLRKDAVKEPLFDILGSSSDSSAVSARSISRSLSNASFAVLFSLSRECLACGTSLVLEGNFRPNEHEAPLLSLCADPANSIAQIICRASDSVRRARLLARADDPTRHPGHRDSTIAAEMRGSVPDLLALPGVHFVFDTDAIGDVEDGLARVRPLLLSLDAWRNSATP